MASAVIMIAGGGMLIREVVHNPLAAATAIDPMAPSTSSSASPSAVRRMSAPPRLTVNIKSPGFLAWAVVDRRNGRMGGSANAAAGSDTMSTIKVWLAADYLTNIDPDPTVKRIGELKSMIVNSNNNVATATYRRNGTEASIHRMVSTCRLTDSSPRDRWSTTVVSARDLARLGDCIADGRAASPRWTEWLLTQMRNIRGASDFGARTIFAEPTRSQIAIKNGWYLREDKQWHMSCLAIAKTWSLAVLIRYPSKLGLNHGKTVCREVAAQLFKL